MNRIRNFALMGSVAMCASEEAGAAERFSPQPIPGDALASFKNRVDGIYHDVLVGIQQDTPEDAVEELWPHSAIDAATAQLRIEAEAQTEEALAMLDLVPDDVAPSITDPAQRDYLRRAFSVASRAWVKGFTPQIDAAKAQGAVGDLLVLALMKAQVVPAFANAITEIG